MDIENITKQMQEKMNTKPISRNLTQIYSGRYSSHIATIEKIKKAIKTYQEEEKNKGNENIPFEIPKDQNGRDRVIDIFKNI